MRMTTRVFRRLGSCALECARRHRTQMDWQCCDSKLGAEAAIELAEIETDSVRTTEFDGAQTVSPERPRVPPPS